MSFQTAHLLLSYAKVYERKTCMSERCNEKFVHTRRAHLHLAKVTKCWSPSHICARGNMTCDGDIYMRWVKTMSRPEPTVDEPKVRGAHVRIYEVGRGETHIQQCVYIWQDCGTFEQQLRTSYFCLGVGSLVRSFEEDERIAHALL